MGPIDAAVFGDADLIVALGGHGKVQMGVHTRYLLDTIDGIDIAIAAGAAGALSPELAIGDVVIAERIVEHDYTERFDSEPLPEFDASAELVSRLIGAISPSGFAFRQGVIASGDEDVIDVERGIELANKTGAIAVAWEGAGIARACDLTNIP